MRTTVNIDANLLAAAKGAAAERGTTLGELLGESIQTYLAFNHRAQSLPALKFPVAPGRFIAPVDPTSNRDLLAYLDAVEESQQ